jgi:hypothetical protein
MSAGSVTLAEIDATATQLARAVFSALYNIQKFKENCLDTLTDNDLLALNYTAPEVARLRSAISDLDQLRTIFQSGATLPTAKDFRVFAKQLLKTGLY